MKKVLAFILAALMVLSLAACRKINRPRRKRVPHITSVVSALKLAKEHGAF